MKSTSKLQLLCMALAFTGAMSLQSCKNEKPSDTEENAEEHNEAKFDNVNEEKEDDADFLVDVAEINLEEIQLGKLAQKSLNADVKSHGKMMEAQHTQSFNELKLLAEVKQITIPLSVTKDGMDAYNKLSDEKTANFDKAYADMMVDGHKKAIAEFEAFIGKTKDAELKDWAAKTLEGLRTHLDHSLTLQQKVTK